MINKKVKEIKTVSGAEIEWFQGNDTWLQCRTQDGEKFSIGGEVLFKILSNFNFNLVKHGNNWRTADFTIEEKD